MQRWIGRLALTLAILSAGALGTTASAQVTTGSIRGIVTDTDGNAVAGARVTAVHTPSGTPYIGLTRADGRFVIPGMRVGGPYAVAVQMIGFARQSRDDIVVSLGVAADLEFRLSAVATTLQAVTVTSEGGELSSTRTGAATAVSREQLQQLPTITRRLSDFARLSPQAQGNGTSFAGYDDRLNNITVDGASFNNSFGLAGSPGAGRAGQAWQAQAQQHQVLDVHDVGLEAVEHALEGALGPGVGEGLGEVLVLEVVDHDVALEAVHVALEQRVAASREDLLAAEDLHLVSAGLERPGEVVGVHLGARRVFGQEEVHGHQDLHRDDPDGALSRAKGEVPKTAPEWSGAPMMHSRRALSTSR
jgi:hypothetical protein